jgi:multiple sugar transport system substrate-binding protein
MKNRIKKVTAILVIASLVFTIACGQNEQEKHDFGEHEDVVRRAEELKTEMASSFPEVEVAEKIRWLSWYPMDEDAPAAQVFKARYGIPANSPNDEIIERINVSYAQRYEVLANMISSDSSPDMFQFEDRFYPWGVHQNLFDPICDVIDFSGPEWDKMRNVVEMFKWGGRYYAPVHQLANSSGLLFYRKTIMQQNSLDDPYDLWQEGKWTWDVFLDHLAAFTDVPNDRYGVMGFYIDEATIATTGTPLLAIVDGKLQSNMDHGNIERATTFMKTLADNQYRYPYDVLDNFTLNKQALRAGRILFWNDGPWEYQETLQKQMKSDNVCFTDIGIVPWPRDPNANEHFQRGKHDAMMLVSGAPNVDGYRAWIQSSVIAAQDEKMELAGRVKLNRDWNWQECHLNTLDKILEMPVVFDFKNGIGEDVSGATWASPVESLTKPVIMDGESFSAMRDENRTIIETRIDVINSRVASQQ